MFEDPSVAATPKISGRKSSNSNLNDGDVSGNNNTNNNPPPDYRLDQPQSQSQQGNTTQPEHSHSHEQSHVHGGAVLVRGMIRRIWRPRYLEIDTDGVLRYYEAVDASSDHGSIPKTTMNTMNRNRNRNANVRARSNRRRRSPDRDISREMQAFALPEVLTRTPMSIHLDGNGSVSMASASASESALGGGGEHHHQHHDVNATMSDEGTEVEVELEHVYISTNKKECTGNSQDGSTSLLNHVESWDSIGNTVTRITTTAGGSGAGAEQNLPSSSSMSTFISHSNSNNSNSQLNMNINENKSASGTHQATNLNSSLQLQQQQQQQQYVPQHHIHSHRPKATMTILSARLIDVKSLRDIHVGLPKGTYGFVFCGRQIFNNQHETALEDLRMGMGMGNNAGNVGSRSEGLTSHNDQDDEDYWKKYNNHDSVNENTRSNGNEYHAYHHDDFEIRDDICHPLSILSNVDHDYFDSSRDYLCSVSTEEEAKKWVQKLKRAAHVARSKSKSSSLKPKSSYVKKRRHKNNILDVDVHVGGASNNTTVRSPLASPDRGQVYGVLDDLTMMDDDSLMGMSHTRSLLSNSTVCTDSQAAIDGLTIVTRVQGFHVQSLGRKRLLGVNCKVQYRVQMLLLSNEHLLHRSKLREDGSKSQDECLWTVEQKTVVRSHDNVTIFLETFNQMQKGDSDRPLNKIVRDMESSEINDTLSMSLLHKQLAMNVENISKALRIITSDPALCNTKVAKEFLGVLNQTKSGTVDTNDTSTGGGREWLEISIDESVDEFVKKWLYTKPDTSTLMERLYVYAMLMLQKPNIEALLYVKLTLLVKYMIQGWWSELFGHTIKVRIDVLAAIMVTLYYAGYNAGLSNIILYHQQSSRTIKPESPEKKQSISRGTRTKIKRKQQMLDECSLESENVGYSSSNASVDSQILSSPLPELSEKYSTSCWSRPDDKMFNVRGKNYLKDRIKFPSGQSLFKCRGIDMFLTDNPERNISRLPCCLGGKLAATNNTEDTFLVNFLLPFGNFVMYFSVAKEESMPANVAKVWKNFINGDQMYRDARLKLLPVVIDGPWIVKKAVGPGTAPALLSQSIPLQYYFTHPTEKKKGIYEVDVIITASKIARGILSVVKSHTKRLTIGMAFIIEAATEDELPEAVLASCQLHSLHLELCPQLPKYYLEEDFAN